MKSIFLVTFALLAAATSVSAFAQNYSRQTITSTTKLCMARSKPAKSQEDDVELTRAIIMKHIGSVDDYVDDGADEEVEDVVTNSSVGEERGRAQLAASIIVAILRKDTIPVLFIR